MKKILQGHFLISILLIFMLIISLSIQYKKFKFYVDIDYPTKLKIYESLDNNFELYFYKVRVDSNNLILGDTILNTKNSDKNYNLKVYVDGQEYTHTIEKINEHELYISPLKIPNQKYEQISLEVIDNLDTTQLHLVESNYQYYFGKNDNFKFTSILAHDNVIELGKLSIYDLSILKNYDSIQLEYRYYEDEKPIVFFTLNQKISSLSGNDICLKKNKLINDVVFQDKKIDIVVILKGKEELTFSIPIKKLRFSL